MKSAEETIKRIVGEVKSPESAFEATAQNMQNLIGSSIDLAKKIGEIGKTKQEKKNLEITYKKTEQGYRDW